MAQLQLQLYTTDWYGNIVCLSGRYVKLEGY